MIDQIVLSLLKEVVVPELANFIKDKFTSTGQWPTKEEMEARADSIWQANRDRGLEFLNRPKSTGPEKLAFDDNGL